MADLVERYTELKRRVTELRDFFDWTTEPRRLGALEAQQADSSFWSNADRARTTVQEIKSLKGWVTPFTESRSGWNCRRNGEASPPSRMRPCSGNSKPRPPL